MKKHRDPREEKEKDYENQFFSPGKYDKAFRRTWPRKKAKTQRKYRRVQNQVLSQYEQYGEEKADKSIFVRRDQLQKWEVYNLRERIQRKKLKRIKMIGARKNRQGKS